MKLIYKIIVVLYMIIPVLLFISPNVNRNDVVYQDYTYDVPTDNIILESNDEEVEVLESRSVYSSPNYIESESVDNFIFEDNVIPSIGEDDKWWTDDELRLTATLIYFEAGSSDITDEHQMLVGKIAWNRVNDSRFPNTLEEVILQKDLINGKIIYQYNPWYVTGDHSNIYNTSSYERCLVNAEKVLSGDKVITDCPDNVIYQAEFKQGTGIYKSFYVKSEDSTTYFCYG